MRELLLSTKGRKLIPSGIFYDLFKLAEQGVPLTRIIRDYNLALTSQHLNKLFNYYKLYLNDPEANRVIYNSLFPKWLYKSTGPVVIQPTNLYVYKGYFPYGEWQAK